jgi:hypothetical protein
MAGQTATLQFCVREAAQVSVKGSGRVRVRAGVHPNRYF